MARIRRIPLPSIRYHHARLEGDHISPGGPSTLHNTRLLCPACNYYRSDAKLTDGEVLARMKRLFMKALPIEHLWWLNIAPGVGGRPFRGKKHETESEELSEPLPIRN